MTKKIIHSVANITLSVVLLTAAVCSQAVADQSLLERGEYLVTSIMACGNCHSSRTPDGELIEGMELAGNFVIEEPGFEAYAPNITPDTQSGIGNWTDAEIIRAVREGIRKDGQVMGPPMAFPFYRNVSDKDMRAVVAYLRSVTAVKNEVPRSTYAMELPPNWGPPVGVVDDVSRDDVLAYGEYLVGPLGHCTHCHTPIINGQHDFSLLGAGGNLFAKPLGYSFTVLASNITQHAQLGIGQWSDDDIKRVITTGINRGGQPLRPFMAFSYYSKISDQDLDAIVAYLRTIPPSTVLPPTIE